MHPTLSGPWLYNELILVSIQLYLGNLPVLSSPAVAFPVFFGVPGPSDSVVQCWVSGIVIRLASFCSPEAGSGEYWAGLAVDLLDIVYERASKVVKESYDQVDASIKEHAPDALISTIEDQLFQLDRAPERVSTKITRFSALFVNQASRTKRCSLPSRN